MADIIRLARDKNIENSRKDAILFLDFQNHIVGQQWQVRYYRDESQTEIDTLVAIGVRNGTGSECYKGNILWYGYTCYFHHRDTSRCIRISSWRVVY